MKKIVFETDGDIIIDTVEDEDELVACFRLSPQILQKLASIAVGNRGDSPDTHVPTARKDTLGEDADAS